MGNPVNQQRFKGDFFSGSINNIAMWNVKLSDEQSYALFLGASGSLEEYGSRYFKVSYPSMIEVAAGTGLPLGSVNRTLAQISGSLATPNKMSDIIAVGNIAREIAYDFQAWSGSSDFSDGIEPFIENESYIDDSPFYSIGTTFIPGFNAPLKDKIQVNIDITPRSDLRGAIGYGYQGQYIYRNWKRWASEPSDSEIPNTTRSGMLYWSPQTKQWDTVGTRNPQYRTNIAKLAQPMYGKLDQEPYADGVATLTGSIYSCSHASQFMPYNYFQSTNSMLESIQNASVNYNAQNEDGKISRREMYIDEVEKSMAHVGLPHCHNFAPFGSRYFATSSNLLKMSNYINSPMLLEKIELDFGKIIANQNFDFGDDYLCSSPFSMYTFFLYRQTQDGATQALQANGEYSSKSKVALDIINSGSERELIGWSTAVFYNEFASSSISFEAVTGSATPGFKDGDTGNVAAQVESYGAYPTTPLAVDSKPISIWNVPISPTSSLHADWYHAWGINPTSFSSTKRAQYTGSMKLQFTPKVCGPRNPSPEHVHMLIPLDAP